MWRSYLKALLAIAAGGLIFVGSGAALAAGGPKASVITAPLIACGVSTTTSIDILVCAPATGTGLPAGFTLQWMTKADFLANNSIWPSSDSTTIPSFCAGSFSGNANLSRYNLIPGECTDVRTGDILFDNGASLTGPGCGILECGTTYEYRAFGHATSTLGRSVWSSNLECSTLPCSELPPPGCTLTQGYWKNHNEFQPPFQPDGVTPDPLYVVWPDGGSLTLGTVSYTNAQLESMLLTPTGGNGLLSLAHQLIAAKLNIANGSDPTDIASVIALADAAIGSLVVPPVGTGSLPPSSVSALVTALNNYNTGLTGPGHCDGSETP